MSKMLETIGNKTRMISRSHVQSSKGDEISSDLAQAKDAIGAAAKDDSDLLDATA